LIEVEFETERLEVVVVVVVVVVAGTGGEEIVTREALGFD